KQGLQRVERRAQAPVVEQGVLQRRRCLAILALDPSVKRCAKHVCKGGQLESWGADGAVVKRWLGLRLRRQYCALLSKQSQNDNSLSSIVYPTHGWFEELWCMQRSVC